MSGTKDPKEDAPFALEILPESEADVDESEIIVLTRVSSSSRPGLKASQQQAGPHTLDNVFEDAPKAKAKEPEDDEPILLLSKREAAPAIRPKPHTLEREPDPFASTSRDLRHELALVQEDFMGGQDSHEELPWNSSPKPATSGELFLQSFSVALSPEPLSPSGEPDRPQDQELLDDLEELRMSPMVIEAQTTPIPISDLTTPSQPTSPPENAFSLSPPVSNLKDMRFNDTFRSSPDDEQGSTFISAPELSEDSPIRLEDLPELPVAQDGVASTHVDMGLSEDMFLKGLLDELAQHCGRACVFIHRPPLLLGHDGKGLRHNDIKDVLFPLHLESSFAKVIQTQKPYKGELPATALDQILVATLGDPLPHRIALFPIVQKQEVQAIIYLDDQGGHSAFLDDPSTISSLVKRAELLDYRWSPPDLLELYENHAKEDHES